MQLHRHRVSTFLNQGEVTDWSIWYSNEPKVRDPNIQIETKEFADDQVQRIGSSKQLGALYKESTEHEHLRY